MKTEKSFLEIGKIVKPQGIKGEVKVYPWSDYPEDLLEFDVFYIGAEKKALSVEESRSSGGMVYIYFENFLSFEDAASINGEIIHIDRADAILPEGRFFVSDLIGAEVIDDETGQSYGLIKEITNHGAQDIYFVEKDGKTVLIPAVADVVIKRTLIEEKKVYITPIPGLFAPEIVGEEE